MQDFGAECFFVADCFEVGEALVDFSIPQVFRDSRLGVNCPRDESAARIFVSFDSHDVVVVFESVDGPPLSRGEIGEGEFSPVGKTALPVFVLEFGDAHFSTSVGERGFPLRGDIETRDVVDAWLLDRRVPVEKGFAANVISKSFETFFDIVGRPRSGGVILQSFSQKGSGSTRYGCASAQVVAHRIEGVAIEFGRC